MFIRFFAGALSAVFFFAAGPGRAVNLTTQHNDNFRTGANTNEYVLNTSNVNAGAFGKVFSRSVDGQIYAQPLYVHSLTISNKLRNVIYTCTEHNSVYAFDADDATITNALWWVNFPTSVPQAEVFGCSDLTVEIGITATPVIDLPNGTIFIESKLKVASVGTTNYFHKLHALDLLTGAEKFGGPATITGIVVVAGSGGNSVNGTNTFNALHHHFRPGLLLLSNNVYMACASHCDIQPYNGWVFGYNATNLARTTIFCVTPRGVEGGIWMGGTGMSADEKGNIYATTGNGTFDANTNGPNFSDSYLKFSLTSGAFAVSSWFTPHDQVALNAADLDIGTGGPLLFPGANLLMGIGKTSTAYVLSTTNLGGYTTGPSDTTNLVQEFRLNNNNTCCIGMDPIYWRGPTNDYVFTWIGSDVLRAFLFTGTNLQTSPLATGAYTQNQRVGGISLSANGRQGTSAVIWGTMTNGSNISVVRAFSATNVAHELWNSTNSVARDAVGATPKFCAPAIANGKVYVPTESGSLVVYGLLISPSQLWQQNNFTASEQTNSAISGDLADPDGDGFPNLLEYAFNTNPRVTTTNGMPAFFTQPDTGTNYLATTFTRILYNTDISYFVDVSPDLYTWYTGPTNVVQYGSAVDNGDGSETVTYRDAIPEPVATQRFIRVRITRP